LAEHCTAHKLHGGLWRVVHDGEALTGLNLPLGTGSGYPFTEVILSDNAQEAPISGPTHRKLTPEALDTNIMTEYHTDCYAGLLDPTVLPERGWEGEGERF